MDWLLRVWLYYILIPYWAITGILFALAYYLPQPRQRQLAGFGARALCYVAGLSISASYGATAAFILRFFGKAGLSQYLTARCFKWIMYPLVGVWFDVDEESRKRLDSPRPVVLVANHQSELDILLLAYIYPRYSSISAKSDLKWYPFLGPYSKLTKDFSLVRIC
jgi:lysophosphatidate acyltransferase